MKTPRFLCFKLLAVFCALLTLPLWALEAGTINSTYTGPINGNCSDPANWSPPIVPDNTNDRKFNVSIGGPDGQVTLDINTAIKSLAFTDPGDFFGSFLNSTDHNLISGATNVDGWGLYFSAETRSVLADLGNVADFSDTTLNSGIYQADTTYSDPSLGLTATIKFNSADIRTNKAYRGLFGAGARIVDQNVTIHWPDSSTTRSTGFSILSRATPSSVRVLSSMRDEFSW